MHLAAGLSTRLSSLIIQIITTHTYTYTHTRYNINITTIILIRVENNKMLILIIVRYSAITRTTPDVHAETSVGSSSIDLNYFSRVLFITIGSQVTPIDQLATDVLRQSNA